MHYAIEWSLCTQITDGLQTDPGLWKHILCSVIHTRGFIWSSSPIWNGKATSIFFVIEILLCSNKVNDSMGLKITGRIERGVHRGVLLQNKLESFGNETLS